MDIYFNCPVVACCFDVTERSMFVYSFYSLGQAWVPIRRPVSFVPEALPAHSQQERPALSHDNVPGFEEPLLAPPVDTGPCSTSQEEDELFQLIKAQFDKSVEEGETPTPKLNYATSYQEWFSWGKTAIV